MTSAVEGAGASLGFVNRAFIKSGKTATPFNNYGGEDRFWLGPEGGQFGLYFPPGKAFEFGNWPERATANDLNLTYTDRKLHVGLSAFHLQQRNLLVLGDRGLPANVIDDEVCTRTGARLPSGVSVGPWQTSPCHSAPERSACQRRRVLMPSPSAAAVRTRPRSTSIRRTVHAVTPEPNLRRPVAFEG